MKNTTWLLPSVLLSLLPALALAQGPLTPPAGAPAPTMKSLDQIEARTPLVAGSPGVAINLGTITISEPGSYYLTGHHSANLSHGIVIRASDVTLDLNGFRIRSSALSVGGGGTGTGIRIEAEATQNVTISNGSIVSSFTYNGTAFTGQGFSAGILTVGEGKKNVVVRDITVSGVGGRGISLETTSNAIVDSCAVNTVGGNGIMATVVRDCAVHNAGGEFGIWAWQIENSRGHSVGGSGIHGVERVAHSSGETRHAAVGSHGIVSEGDVTHSYGRASVAGSGNGIRAQFGVVSNSSGRSNGGDGIYADTVVASYGFAATGALHGINATHIVHSRGRRQSAEAGKYGMSGTRAVGSYLSEGDNVTQKYDMP